jgi:hypothetical protein
MGHIIYADAALRQNRPVPIVNVNAESLLQYALVFVVRHAPENASPTDFFVDIRAAHLQRDQEVITT